MDLVSIVIPTYNRADYLPIAIDSCLTLDYQNIEVIIVDDGSTDQTSEIVDNISDTRVHYFQLDNNGACYARNFGIRKANGKFIKFLDSDDTLKHYSISQQVKAYYQLKCKFREPIICGYHELIDKDGRKLRIRKKLGADFKSLKSYEIKDIIVNNPPTSIPLYPSQIFESYSAFDSALAVLQDYDLPFRLSLLGCSFIHSNICVYQMRVHQDPKSVSLIKSKSHASHHYDILNKHWILLQKFFKSNGFCLSTFLAFGARYYMVKRKISKSPFRVKSPFKPLDQFLFILSPKAAYYYIACILRK